MRGEKRIHILDHNSMKPKRIILIRHGQSEGNVNKSVYNVKPDYSVNLTDVGREQAYRAGVHLKEIIGEETICAYVSPYYRTKQTFEEIKKSINFDFYREDPRLREHEWASKLIDRSKLELERECKEYGVFYYRFEHGESCADVYDRLSTFLESLHRDFIKEDFSENVLIVGHGMSNRVFLMRWFHWTVDEFELLKNPKNCEMIMLELQNDGKYKLKTDLKKHQKKVRLF